MSTPQHLPPHGGLREVSKSALWKSWKEIRKELRRSSLRDVVDFIDYDLNPDTWIERILKELRSGSYEPRRPRRFTLGKSQGFSRWMTLPEIPDLVLYHTVATRIIDRSQRRRHQMRNVYFARDKIHKIRSDARKEAEAETSRSADYGRYSFLVWLRFHQYRQLLILRNIYPYIVITDITNFFDSIAHIQIEAALSELGFSRSFTGLVQLILERLMFRDPFSAHPRTGIPVDEFDCSRCLAHVVLFPHDDRMVKAVGEDAYVRWMDDQTFGVKTEAEAYSILSETNVSLRRLHLAPNSGKTRILTLSDARQHFHFAANDGLDRLDREWQRGQAITRKARIEQRKSFRKIWQRARKNEGRGEWGKVLKRAYLAAGRLGLRLFVQRAHGHVLSDPALARRVAEYLRVVCSTHEFLSRLQAILEDERIVYDDVRRAFAEQLLRLEPTTTVERRELRSLARHALRRRTGLRIPDDVAALVLFRFGDGRSARSLHRYLRDRSAEYGARAVALVLASLGESYADVVGRHGRDGLREPLVGVVRLLRKVKDSELPNRIRARSQLAYDPMTGRRFLDTRVLLVAKLYARNPDSRRALRGLVKQKWSADLSPFEIDLVRRAGLA